MRPQKQKYKHGERAASGVVGDCYRTCIAMILNMDRDDVPHFLEGMIEDKNHPNFEADQDRIARAIDSFLADYGLVESRIAYNAASVDEMLTFCKHHFKGPIMLLGNSRDGVGHAVVINDGEVFDPNWCGLAGPTDDNFIVVILSVGNNWKPVLV